MLSRGAPRQTFKRSSRKRGPDALALQSSLKGLQQALQHSKQEPKLHKRSFAYAEAEAEAMKQQAHIQAQSHILKVKKEAAAALAEAAVQREEQQSLCWDHPLNTSVDSKQKVQDYVDNQPLLQDNQLPTRPPTTSTNPFCQGDIVHSELPPAPFTHPVAKQEAPKHSLIQQSPCIQNYTPNPPQTSAADDVAKYLMRRELVSAIHKITEAGKLHFWML